MSPSKAVSLIAGDRKIVILRGQFWTTHSSVAVGLKRRLVTYPSQLLIPSPFGETAVGSLALMKKGLKHHQGKSPNTIHCFVGSLALMKKGLKPISFGWMWAIALPKSSLEVLP